MRVFRVLLGSIFMLLALIFLVANTAILGRYGWKSGTDEFEATVNMIVAGSVPLALALMPFALMVSWIKGRYVEHRGKTRWKRGRPSGMVLVGFALYGVFVAFNFMGAIGSIALQKTEFVDRREGTIDEIGRLRETRARKVAELEKLSGAVARPSAAVQADLAGAKIHRFWSQTSECSEARSRGHSRFCGQVAGWKREASNAEQAEHLRGEIDAIDKRLNAPGAKIASADPQSETLAYYVGEMTGRSVSAKQVRMAQPLVWFLLLELACMVMLAIGCKFFRISHDVFADFHEPALPPGRQLPPAGKAHKLQAATLPSDGRWVAPEAIVITGAVEDPELQAAVYSRFWSDCTRRLPASQVAATAAYGAYRAYAGRPENNVIPYPFAEFVRRCGDHVAHQSTIGGTLFFSGVALAEPMGGV
jgi:hypothetical protein